MDEEGITAGGQSALQHAFSLALSLQVMFYISNPSHPTPHKVLPCKAGVPSQRLQHVLL